MRRGSIAVAAGLVLLFSGCRFFPSGEASIVSFDLAGLTVSASIDADARTVVVEAPPVELAQVVPAIGVSEGAELGTLPSFQDGQPAVVQVIAPNGDEPEVELSRGFFKVVRTVDYAWGE